MRILQAAWPERSVGNPASYQVEVVVADGLLALGRHPIPSGGQRPTGQLIYSKKWDLLNSLLRDDGFADVTMDVGEAEVATLESVGEALVIEA